MAFNSRFRTDLAGTSGLAHLRTGEIVSASCDEILTALRDHDGSDHGVISSSISSLLRKMQEDVAQMVNLGTSVDAGCFNLETLLQRSFYQNSSVGAPIRDTLSSCPPSFLLLFSDPGTRIKDALDAARSASHFSSSQAKKSGRGGAKSQSKKRGSCPAQPRSSAAPKAPAAPSASYAGKGRGRSRGGGQQKPPAQ